LFVFASTPVVVDGRVGST